jgi:serine/threonine protein kinase
MTALKTQSQFFSRWRTRHSNTGFDQKTIDTLKKELFPCDKCQKTVPLADLTPLQMWECPSCHEINFIPQQIGRFWLYEPLGGGGMGSVYKACSCGTPGKTFAVKILSRIAKNDASCINALLTESQIARCLRGHPSLVQYEASGFEDGEYYCAMEYIKGERIDDAIQRLERMPVKTVLEIALHILAGEQHIYKCGYLYRDLKPENVVLQWDTGRVIMLDFGLCLPLDKALHPDDQFVSGSPYYIPPERLWGTGETMASEIYSLGMVMYQALTGQTYYDANEVEELAKRHISNTRLAVSGKMKGFGTDLVDIMTKMLKRDKEERYQSYAEVARDIYRLHSELN